MPKKYKTLKEANDRIVVLECAIRILVAKSKEISKSVGSHVWDIERYAEGALDRAWMKQVKKSFERTKLANTKK